MKNKMKNTIIVTGGCGFVWSNLIKHFKNKYMPKINKDIYDKTSLILIKISKVNYNPNSKIKLIAGPIKIDISFYYLSKRGAVKANPNEKRVGRFLGKSFCGFPGGRTNLMFGEALGGWKFSIGSKEGVLKKHKQDP